MIVSDYELMADLATFYGHVEELRWRLRFKAEPAVDETSVSPIIATFVSQMADAVDVLLEQVREQMVNPQVEQIVGAPQTKRPTRVARTRQFTGAIRAQTPEEIEKALAGAEPARARGNARQARRLGMTRAVPSLCGFVLSLAHTDDEGVAAMQGKLAWTFAITTIALFMTALDNLVVVTALPPIQKDLGASLTQLEWVVNAYTLTFAVLLLTGAALGDRFGRKRMFVDRPDDLHGSPR